MPSPQLTILLADVALITLVARVLGLAARRLDQPAVLGELGAGILLGPTLFGGTLARTLFPHDVRPFLGLLASLGVVFFMLTIGLDLDQALVRRRSRTVSAVALGSMGLPLVMGALVALTLAGAHAGHGGVAFCVFVAAAMSVTAFPVLARILADRGMCDTSVGQMALACAAANDVVAWILVAIALAVSHSSRSAWPMLFVAPYILVMVGVARPLLARLPLAANPEGGHRGAVLALVSAGVLLSAAVTNAIGMTPVFGAFLFGAIVPGRARAEVREAVTGSIGHFSVVVLLPIFFVTAGLGVDLSQIGAGGLAELGLILGVAVVSKFAGAFFAARWSGVATRESAAMATLMNARGLTELIVLTLGLQMGVIDHRLYSLMVAMAMITTAMTGPLLRTIYPKRALALERYEPAPVTGPAY